MSTEANTTEISDINAIKNGISISNNAESTDNETNASSSPSNSNSNCSTKKEEKENKENKEEEQKLERIRTKNGFYQQKVYTLASTNEQRIYKSSITDQEKPDTLQDMIADLEDITLTERDRIFKQSFASINNLNTNLVEESIRQDFESFIKELSKLKFDTPNDWRKYGMRPLLKKYTKLGQPKKAAMRKVYMNLLRLQKIESNESLENYLIAKASRTKSGVMVVTVLTSPYPRVKYLHRHFLQKFLIFIIN